MATRIMGAYGGYRKMFSFGWTCLVYHATTLFCQRNYNYKNDALGKTTGQMVGAARSARQNIVEASSRAATSVAQELKQLDVAKDSLDELAGDYEAFLVDAGEAPWSVKDPRHAAVQALELDFRVGTPLSAMVRSAVPSRPHSRHSASLLSNRMRSRRDSRPYRVGVSRGRHSIEEGGFTERLSKARLETRDAQVAAEGAPKCPKCGRPMRKMVAKKGRNAGNAFWSCTAYPDCNGTRSF